MEITAIEATAHRVGVEPLGPGESTEFPIALVTVETDAGIIGFGEAGVYPGAAVVPLINDHLAPRLVGQDPRRPEAIRGAVIRDDRQPPSLQSAAASMLDIACWDIKGKAAGEPIWRLLGGTDPMVEVYVTIGTDVDDLGVAAATVAEEYASRLKITVGEDATPAEDEARIETARHAIGDIGELAMDANASLGINRALELSERARSHGLAWFEEPVQTNEAGALANLRSRSPIPIAAGQFAGHRRQHWDLVRRDAIDLVQPNVCYVGGFTEGRKVAAMAETAGLDLAHAGGWPFQNMHLVGAAANGWRLEVHNLSWAVGERLYRKTPRIDDGAIELPDQPGVGLEPDPDVLEETRVS